ncbi:MAG: sterol desaturase family protein [Leptospiraceae bacterium]|nr:sterol desaturase family protein [Leptospiraceae bacterium]
MEPKFPEFVTYAIPFFFLLIFIELIYGAVKGRKLYRLNDSIADLGTGVLNRLFGLLSASASVAVYWLVYEHVRLFDLPAQPSWEWSMVLTFSACFVLYDLAYYWAHRMSHEINFLWATHVVHHQSEEYNLTVALRQSAFGGLVTWPFYLPLALLGFHPAVMLANGALSLIYQFWIHTRAIGRMGFLESFMNTPSHHRVHHGKNPKYLDKNHAGTFIIWDKMFGTFQVEEEEPVYGTVQPFKSFNPFWANLHYWKEMWDVAVRAPRFKDKILIWFKHPGWRPAEMGGSKEAPELDANTYEKFDVTVPVPLSIYSLVWFAAITAFTLICLFKVQAGIFNMWQIGGISAAATFSLICVGGILEGKRWARILEPLRLVAIAAFALAAVGRTEWLADLTPNLYWAYGVVAASALSLLIVMKYRTTFTLTTADYASETMHLEPGKRSALTEPAMASRVA